MKHRQDWCGNARSNDEVKDEPVLTASHVLKEHPFETRQEDKVPEIAAAIWEWHLVTPPLIGSIFGGRQQPETGLVNLTFWVKTHCLEVLSSE